MSLSVDCCLVISFFGIIFYVSMGFIVIGQQEFLRFQPHDRTGTIVSCFIAAVIFVLFMIGMIVIRRRQAASAVQRENYVQLGEDRERKFSEVKGIPMSEFRKYRQE